MHPGAVALRTPDKPAYIVEPLGEVVTYRQLDEHSNQCAHLFRHLGLAPGASVALFLVNDARFFEPCWGAQRSGLYYTPISTHLTAAEVAYIVEDSGAEVLIVSHELREVAAELVGRMPRLRARFVIGGTIPGFESFEAAMADHPVRPIADEMEGIEMLYSSGTTGKPKGIKNPFTRRAIGTPPPLLRGLLAGMFGASPETVYLSPAPNYHSAPLRFLMALQRLGATSVILEHFDPALALEVIARYRVTLSQWVPTMFVRLLKLPEEERARHDLSSHRVALHAAAPCPIRVKERMIEWWGPILIEYYGATEGNGSTQIDSAEWLAHKGSVGRPLNCQVHILDDDGSEVAPREVGTVYFGGGTPFEYHNDPEKTAATRSRQGWSTVGDMGYVDEEGYLYLTDRKANMIISGGVNIYPQEAENVLITHPLVADVAVFGVPNEEFGEEVKAVVQLVDASAAGPSTERELIDFCRRHLAKLKCPRSIDFETQLPRTETGKLLKRQLRERYWAGHATRVL
jgi:acyl-CoA synthetase (AMP-forming)/AMP-acid ligase II